MTQGNAVRGRIIEKLEEKGWLSLADFMETCLYEPEIGYYERGTFQVGRAGDFYTSVSVGPVFGELLASMLV